MLEERRVRAAPSASTTAPGLPLDVAAIVRHLWRRKFTLVVCGLLGAISLPILAKMLPVKHVASAEILVDPRDLKVLDKEVTPRSVATDSGITVVESQVQVLTSDSVLKRAIAAANLLDDAEFTGAPRGLIGSYLAEFKSIFSDNVPVPLELAALQALKQKVAARRPERTFVIELAVTTETPEKSVRIADAIVEGYLADAVQYRATTNEGAAESIDSGIDALRQKVASAEQRIAAYKEQNNLVITNGKLFGEQQLTEAINQLVQARLDMGRLKARFEDIQASRSAPEAIPETIASAALTSLKRQLSTVAGERAKLASQLKPGHPAMQAVDQQEREVRRQFDQEITRVMDGSRHDYERAKSAESALAKRVDDLRQLGNATEKAQIVLRELERDLDASRGLYAQSVARSRETRQESRINTSNVRVISSATPLPYRSFPPRPTILIPGGFLLGLGSAIAAIIFANWRPLMAGERRPDRPGPTLGSRDDFPPDPRLPSQPRRTASAVVPERDNEPGFDEEAAEVTIVRRKPVDDDVVSRASDADAALRRRRTIRTSDSKSSAALTEKPAAHRGLPVIAVVEEPDSHEAEPAAAPNSETINSDDFWMADDESVGEYYQSTPASDVPRAAPPSKSDMTEALRKRLADNVSGKTPEQEISAAERNAPHNP